MRLKQARIVGVQSDANSVEISMQLADTEDTSRPIKLTLKAPELWADKGMHVVRCQFSDLPNHLVVATQRELAGAGRASIYIKEM